MLITLCHIVNCQRVFLYSLPGGNKKPILIISLRNTFSLDSVEINYLTHSGKLNLSWACTAAWQASCWLPREFLRTVVQNPNCFHCSPVPSPTPAVRPLKDDLTSRFTTKTDRVGSFIPLFFKLHDAWCFCLHHNAWVSKKTTSIFFFFCLGYAVYLDTWSCSLSTPGRNFSISYFNGSFPTFYNPTQSSSDLDPSYHPINHLPFTSQTSNKCSQRLLTSFSPLTPHNQASTPP